MTTKLNISALGHYEPRHLDRPELQRAAVLIPVIQREDGDLIVLTARHERLKYQPGLISFPGGKLEEGDSNLLDCALRETEEEISLPPAQVEILAEMDQVTVGSRYLVTPFVGLIARGVPLTPSVDEVRALIVANVADLIGREALSILPRMPNGMDKPTHAFATQGSVVWGATARILKRFLEVGYGARYPVSDDW